MRFRPNQSVVLAVLPGIALLLSLIPPRAFAHGDIHQRIQFVTEEIQQRPNDAALYVRRGELHGDHGQWEPALADFDRAARIDPTLILVELARGTMFLSAGRHAEAKECLDKYLAQMPAHSQGLATRARTLVKLGRTADAVKDYSNAIAHAPVGRPEFFFERAQAEASLGTNHLDAAIRGLDEGLAKLGPVITLRLLAADLEVQNRRFDAALKRVDEILRTSHRKDNWYLRRGEILEQAGRPHEAVEAYLAAWRAMEALPPGLKNSPALMEKRKKLGERLQALASNSPRPKPPI